MRLGETNRRSASRVVVPAQRQVSARCFLSVDRFADGGAALSGAGLAARRRCDSNPSAMWPAPCDRARQPPPTTTDRRKPIGHRSPPLLVLVHERHSENECRRPGRCPACVGESRRRATSDESSRDRIENDRIGAERAHRSTRHEPTSASMNALHRPCARARARHETAQKARGARVATTAAAAVVVAQHAQTHTFRRCQTRFSRPGDEFECRSASCSRGARAHAGRRSAPT